MNERLKELRNHLNLTQSAFGANIGLTPGAVSKIESGTRTPADSTLKLICATYHVNYLWLTQGEGPMLEEAIDPESFVERYAPGETPLFKSIAAAFCHLPDEEWEKLRQLIDRIKKEGHP